MSQNRGVTVTSFFYCSLSRTAIINNFKFSRPSEEVLKY